MPSRLGSAAIAASAKRAWQLCTRSDQTLVRASAELCHHGAKRGARRLAITSTPRSIGVVRRVLWERCMRAAVFAAVLALLVPCAAAGQSVNDIARRGACSTAGVERLARQLIETQQCMGGGGFVRFDGHRNIHLTSTRVHPFVQRSARDALHRVAGGCHAGVGRAPLPPLALLSLALVPWRARAR